MMCLVLIAAVLGKLKFRILLPCLSLKNVNLLNNVVKAALRRSVLENLRLSAVWVVNITAPAIWGAALYESVARPLAIG